MAVKFDWWTAPNPDVLVRMLTEEAKYEGSLPTFFDTAPVSFRLFGAACARRLWPLLTAEERISVITSERFAAGRATATDLRASVQRDRGRAGATPRVYAEAAVALACWFFPTESIDLPHWPTGNPIEAAQEAAKALASDRAGPAPPGRPTTPEWHSAWNKAFAAARAEQADFFRDIFPPPGATITADPRWRTSTILALARHMTETGDFSHTAVLADALEEAGCDDERVLRQCRDPGPHVRGNWVVELLMPAV